MINGGVAKTTNLGIIAIILVCIVGIIFLAADQTEIPNELSMLLTSCIGFLIGTKFTPLGEYYDKKPNEIKPTDTITVKEEPKV